MKHLKLAAAMLFAAVLCVLAASAPAQAATPGALRAGQYIVNSSGVTVGYVYRVTVDYHIAEVNMNGTDAIATFTDVKPTITGAIGSTLTSYKIKGTSTPVWTRAACTGTCTVGGGWK